VCSCMQVCVHMLVVYIYIYIYIYICVCVCVCIYVYLDVVYRRSIGNGCLFSNLLLGAVYI
jgi:hypothetical protein